MQGSGIPGDEMLEREKLTYEQNFEQFRQMNSIMWQVPVLAITLTGGFWYAALVVPEAAKMSRWLFVMCAALDLALIWVLFRIRYVMSCYLVKLKEFSPSGFVEAPGTHLFNGSRSVLFAFVISLSVAAAISIASFISPDFMNG